MKTVLIGAGNVATHLGAALLRAGCEMLQVWSRTEESAATLAAKLHSSWTTDLENVTTEAELYVFSVSDAVLPSLASQLYTHLAQTSFSSDKQETDEKETRETEADEKKEGARALFVHTAGSMPVDVLPEPRRGVLYPLQTFSKQREVDISEVPFFVESPTDEALLVALAQRIGGQVMRLDTENRRILHLAAVFACNFTNHMYDLAGRLLAKKDIPFSVLLPLIDETARKVHELSPRQAQTGPAVRGDRNVEQAHLGLLDDEQTKTLYELLSKSIHDKLRPEKN